MDSRGTVSLYDLAFITFKHKWSVVTILLVSLLSGVVWLWLIRDDLYETTAKIMVRMGPEQAAPATVLSRNPMITTFRDQDVNTELAILGSTDLLVYLVDQLGMDKPEPPKPVPAGLIPRIRYHGKAAVRALKDYYDEFMITIGLRERLSQKEKAIVMLQKSLGGAPQKDSNVLEIKLKLPNKQVVHFVLNTLLDDYLAFRRKMHDTPNAVGFFEKEAAQARAQMQASETELKQFEKQSDIVAIDKQQQVLIEQIAQAQRSLADAEIARNETADKVQRLEAQMKKEEPDVAVIGLFGKSVLPEEMLLRLAELQGEREKLRLTELDDGARIRNNRAQFRTLLGVVESNLRSAMADAEAAWQSRRSDVAGLEARLKTLHDSQMQWAALSRTSHVLEENYLFHERKLKEASANAALNQQNVGSAVIIQRAIPPLAPAGMRKLTLLGIILAASLFVCVAWISLAEFFDGGIYRREDLARALDVPVLGALPQARAKRLAQSLEGGGGLPGYHGGSV
jgi:uncharacterized protein involved in exopolysaccharide biosynthesis